MKDQNSFPGMEQIRMNMMNMHKQLEDVAKAFTGEAYQDKLREMMYDHNKEEERTGLVKKMKSRIILTKTGEVVFKFENKEDAKKFFDTIK